MTLTKAVYYWRAEANLYRIELTPAQEAYVLKYCRNFDSLYAYLKTINFEKWEIVLEDGSELTDRFLLDVLEELYDDHGQDAMRMIELFTGKNKDLGPKGSPDWIPTNPEDGAYACFQKYKDPGALAEWYRELDEACK